MNTISKVALVCAVTLFSTHATYGMKDNNKRKDNDNSQPVESNKKPKTVSAQQILEAAREGDVAFFEEHHDIDLRVKDNVGWNPLHYACWKGETAVVKFIAEKYPELL